MPETKIPDLTGTTIGEYEIVSRLGVGGMGVVYEGRQPVIGKRVAVKVLLPLVSTDVDLVERFVSEARAVNEIGHRGIVDIFSFGQLPTGEHYFVMELLNGQPFDRLIKSRGPIPPEEALWWSEEICEALQAAHEAGIIHRDIKPSNLFLVDSGRGRPYVKLLDFGIAKLGAKEGEATPQTRASMVVGTPDYMSPEQARGKAITPATDVYALGCVMFELLTARRAFKGENALETMFMHVENPPPRLSAHVLNPLPALEDLLLWMMEKDPLARPPTADAVAQQIADLRAALPPVMMTPRPSPSRHDLPAMSPSGRQLSLATPHPRSAVQPLPMPKAIPVDLRFTAELPKVEALTPSVGIAPLTEEAIKLRASQGGVPSPVAAAVVTSDEEDPDVDEFGFPKKRFPKAFIAVGVAAALGIAFFAVRKPSPTPTPIVASNGFSAAALEQRIARFEKEAKGNATMIKQFFEKAKADSARAVTDEKRLEVSNYLDDAESVLAR